MMVRCIQLDRDCAAICRTTTSALARGSENSETFYKPVLPFVPLVLKNVTHMDHCRECAKACRRCEEACRSAA